MPKFSRILICISLILILSFGFAIFHFSLAQNLSFEEEQVYVCPFATSLEEVNPDCECRIDLKLGEEVVKECKGKTYRMTLTVTEYEGKEYYTISGFENGGAGVMAKPRLETQIAIVEMIYGGEDILEKVTKDVGDGKPPLLLSELRNATIDLEDYPVEGKLNPGQKKKLKMKFKFLETAGNEYQGKSINVKFKFKATQQEQ